MKKIMKESIGLDDLVKLYKEKKISKQTLHELIDLLDDVENGKVSKMVAKNEVNATVNDGDIPESYFHVILDTIDVKDNGNNEGVFLKLKKLMPRFKEIEKKFESAFDKYGKDLLDWFDPADCPTIEIDDEDINYGNYILDLG